MSGDIIEASSAHIEPGKIAVDIVAINRLTHLLNDLRVDAHRFQKHFIAKPRIIGTKYPGVIVLHDWWGLNDHVKEICIRLAQAGIIAWAPDVYRGEVTIQTKYAKKFMSLYTPEEVLKTLEKAVEELRAEECLKTEYIGIVALGRSAIYASAAAASIPGLKVAVGFGNSFPVEVKNFAASIKCPVLFFAKCARDPDAHDLVVDPNAAFTTFRAHLRDEVAPCFIGETAPPEFNAETAKEIWGCTLAFLKQNLSDKPVQQEEKPKKKFLGLF